MLPTFFVLSSLIAAGLPNSVVIPRSPVFLGQRNRARVAAFRSRAIRNTTRRAIVNEDVDNVAVIYTASIGSGSPATTYDLIIYTGSSNTWVGAGTKYVQTSTSTQTPNRVSVNYDSGSFSVYSRDDQVTLTPGLTIKSQSIGVASSATCFSGFDGVSHRSIIARRSFWMICK
ncbi:hypothetical protein DFS33DRAFT_1451741 [Desarmillaria ectypa]|nr:hypothetical protein DFS33DRAFT_1451741 [Desarmillaria ectypa]